MAKSIVNAAALLSGLVAAQSSYGNMPMGMNSSALPIVDLGYQMNQATYFNATGGFYNFSDIRYAAPPTGERRFRAPVAPAVNRTGVQSLGSGRTRICPQASPAWLLTAVEFIPEYLANPNGFSASQLNTSTSGGSGSLPMDAPGVTEDCLFLDVVVPQGIFENANNGYGAPVMVWIYGGGYTGGQKSAFNPAGLLNRSSESTNQDEVVFVALNYRLGAFGWSSGPTFQEDGTANAGLHDQRFALEWVQKHISKFGGDPNRVTVFGESAGGGSIMHQITAYGGNKGPVPFRQAIPQSPGFAPIVSNVQQETIFQTYLRLLNVSTLAEARQLPYSALQRANVIQVGTASYGQFVYGPTVDGDFVPKLPGELLLHGQFDKSVRVMTGHNAQEGLLFTSPFIGNDSAFQAYIQMAFPTINAFPAALQYLTQTAYPPDFSGSQAQNYTNQIARASALISEAIFTCNAYFLDKAFENVNNQTYAYYFTVAPSLHGQDIAFTFYPQYPPFSGPVVSSVAVALQEYLTDFAIYGRPNSAAGDAVPFFDMYGANATVQELGYNFRTGMPAIMPTRDPAANARCDWWQKALYA